MLSLNLLVSLGLGLLYLGLTITLFYSISQAYRQRERGVISLEKIEREVKMIDGEGPRSAKIENIESSKSGVLSSHGSEKSSERLNRAKILPLGPQNPSEKSGKKQMIPNQDGSCEFNEDYILDTFYQRNHRPLIGLRDFVITFILVTIYYTPKAQTTFVLRTSTSSMVLDVLKKPFKTSEMNREHYLTQGCFLVITIMLTLLSWTEESMSQTVKYYLVGYVSIIAIAILLVYSVSKTIAELVYLIKKYLSKKNKERKNEVNKGKEVIKKSYLPDQNDVEEGSEKKDAEMTPNNNF